MIRVTTNMIIKIVRFILIINSNIDFLRLMEVTNQK